jgi:hypothetical protein
MLDPGELYTPQEAAKFLKVNVCSVYQSLPSSRTKSKLGRTLPEPIRLGRLIRWTGQQLMQFAEPPATSGAAETSLLNNLSVNTGKKPGRPRKFSTLGPHPGNLVSGVKNGV